MCSDLGRSEQKAESDSLCRKSLCREVYLVGLFVGSVGGEWNVEIHV